jgi:hypothetical protein
MRTPPHDDHDNDTHSGFGVIFWMAFCLICWIIMGALITYCFSTVVGMSKSELDHRVEMQKIEIMKDPSNPMLIPMEPVTEDEQELFRKFNNID